MVTVAWVAWGLLTVLVVGGTVVWWRQTGEILAPLPIFLWALGMYAIPRVAFLLGAGESPLTSGGLVRDAQLVLIAKTTLLIAAAIGAFAIGHRSRRGAAAGGQARFSVPEPDPVRVWFVALATAAVGFGSLYWLIHTIGGVRFVIAHQAQLELYLQGKGALMTLSHLVLVPIGLLFLHPATRRMRVTPWLLGALALGSYSILGRRSFVVAAIAYPALLFHLCVHRIKLRYVIAMGIPAAASVVALSFVRMMGTVRLGAALQIMKGHAGLLSHFVLGSSGEFALFDALSILVRDVPDVFPYSYGATFLRVPFQLVPRGLWVDKPVTLGEVVVSRYLPQVKTGYPPFAVGELYAAGGVFAVLIGMVLFGMLCRAVWEWHRRHRGGVGNAVVYIAFINFVFDFTRVGDPSRTLQTFAFGAMFFVIAFSIAAPRSAPSGLAPALARSP